MKKAAEVAFLKVVELRSIRAAARALGQDPSGISRRITQLEQRLGTRLVDRRGNATHVTAQGQVYFERLSSIISQLEALDAEISGENLTPSGLLRVTCAIDFGQQFVADWLLEFRQKYPNVDYDLMLATPHADMNQNAIDVALRVGELPDSSLIARKLGDVRLGLVASPDYLRRKGTPEHPEDLTQHDFVFFSHTNRQQPLELVDADGTSVKVRRSGGIAINAVRPAVKAVAEGQGIHFGPLWAFAPKIASGEIVTVLPEYSHKLFPFYAVRQPSVVVPARISSFIDHVSEKVRSVEGLVPVSPMT